MMELYRVTSTVDNLRHNNHRYNQVKMFWFVADRKMPVVMYKKVIKDYETLPEKDRIFTQTFIKEMFTKKEAEQVKKYLETSLGWKADITPCELPVEGKCLGFRAHQVGELTGFHKLNVGLVYDLPFKTWGFFSVEGIEPVGGFVNTIVAFMDRTRKRVTDLVNRPSPNEKEAV